MDVNVLVPAHGTCLNLVPDRVLTAFDEHVIGFLDGLSAGLLKHSEAKRFSELVALGFWLRKANILRLKKDFLKTVPDDCVRVAKGVLFHITPSNVDTIFVYSLILSLLMGNSNIVRISSKRSAQMMILIDQINALLQDPAYSLLAGSIRIVQYERSKEINDFFSKHCDLRVIWGGDSSINSIRTSPLRSHATDVTFADKYSFALIGADGWLRSLEEERDRLAALFYSDASTFNQQACSSPRMVAWLGSDKTVVDEARSDFWSRVMRVWRGKSDLQPVDFSNRLLYIQRHMVENGSKLAGALADPLCRVESPKMTRADSIEFCGSGVFVEVKVGEVVELLALIDRKIQTISVAGIPMEDLRGMLAPLFSRGVDRVVPFGKALEFRHVWDGYNLWDSFSRLVSL